MARGKILFSKVMEARHDPNDVSALLEQAIGEETDAEEALHVFIQCIYSMAGPLHLLGHLVPEPFEAMLDKYVELAGMAQTADSQTAMDHLLEELRKGGGHEH
jgi:hypothetical protein